MNDMLKAAEDIRQTNQVIDKQQPEETFETKLRKLCGYLANSSETTVTISQDDATKDFIVRVGNRLYHGPSMTQAFDAAFADPLNNPFN